MKLFLNKSNKGEYKVAQRVCSFKKKTRLTVMNMHSKLLNSHSVHPPLFDGEGIKPLTKFSKTGCLMTGPQLLEEVCWERKLYSGGCSFHIKINQNLK